MALTRLASSICDDGDCPTIYKDDLSGDVVVQGYLTDAAPPTPDGEAAVMIPAATWRHLLSQISL